MIEILLDVTVDKLAPGSTVRAPQDAKPVKKPPYVCKEFSVTVTPPREWHGEVMDYSVNVLVDAGNWPYAVEVRSETGWGQGEFSVQAPLRVQVIDTSVWS